MIPPIDPCSPLVLSSSGLLGLPKVVDRAKPTEAEPFHFITDDRAVAKGQVVAEPPPPLQFKAQKLNKKILDVQVSHRVSHACQLIPDPLTAQLHRCLIHPITPPTHLPHAEPPISPLAPSSYPPPQPPQPKRPLPDTTVPKSPMLMTRHRSKEVRACVVQSTRAGQSTAPQMMGAWAYSGARVPPGHRMQGRA